jgi:hypothetical protein
MSAHAAVWHKPDPFAESPIVELAPTGAVCLWKWHDIRAQQAAEVPQLIAQSTEARYLLAEKHAKLFTGAGTAKVRDVLFFLLSNYL